MIRLALKNPIAVLMMSIACVVFAGVVTPRMPIDTFPELTPPVLVVGTLAPGLGAKDVEKTLTWRIEKYVSSTPGVEHVESVSKNNLSIVYVWLAWGTDLNAAQTLVQQQTAFAMSAVPKSLGVLPPFVLQYDPSNAPVVQIAIWGGGMTGAQLYDYAQNVIEPVIEGIPGVASAAPNGGRQRQINVVVDPIAAEARGLTSMDVAAAVAQSNALLPSGSFLSPRFDSNVYTNAVPERVSTIGDAVVRQSGGKPVRVADVARIEDGGSPETQTVSVDGQSAVYLAVLRVPGGNTIEIVDAVGKAIANLHDLPPGLEVRPVFDQSTFVRTTYHGLRKEIVQALVLVALVILLFLQSPRSVAVAAIAIPISFGIILVALFVGGQTLNAFTLGGLTLAMGPLVDISVVVIEAIHGQRMRGKSPYRAALDGARAVAMPTLAATLTTTSVLVPVLLLSGLAKKLFSPLALTIAAGMFAGYLVSMIVTPVACRYLLGDHHPGRIAAAVGAGVTRFADGYGAALRAVMGFRPFVVVGAVVLVGGALAAGSRMPSAFFPEIDESMETIYVRVSPGRSVAEASATIEEMASVLRTELPAGTVALAMTNVGAPTNARSAMTSPNGGPHMGFIRLELVPPERRRQSQRQIADESRRILRERFPGVEVLQSPGGLVASVFSNGYPAPLVVEVRGEDLAALERDARAVAEVARTVPGVRDVRVTLQTDYPEVRVETTRERAGMVGVSARAAAQTTLDATLGNINTPGVWVDPKSGQSYYVVTSYDAARVSDAQALARIPARIEGGRAVPLGAYADVRRSVGPVSIERDRLARAAHVLAQTEGRDIGSAAEELQRKLAAEPRTRGVELELVGQVQLMRTTFSGLGVAIGLAIMLVFMIMAAQFRSLRLPFVMLFTIPVSLIGIVGALLAAGQGFSVIALMGVLMVVGIAVSNGILLVDDANRRLGEGTDRLEAAILAGRARFVPIAMTSLATIVGLVPTALGLEKGTEANQPLALAVVGGLTSSTLLSLFLVPVIFSLVARRPAATEEDLDDAPGAPGPGGPTSAHGSLAPG